MSNEVTGPNVRKIAARLAKITARKLYNLTETITDCDELAKQIKSVAASALTQSPPAKPVPAKSKKIDVRKH
jgi:hypothetical protein